MTPKQAQNWTDDQIDEMISRMETGETLTSIAADPRMPSYRTITRFEDAGDELAGRITRAREDGYQARAERILEEARSAKDAAKGRLVFDADRWYLGKMQPKRFGEKALLGSDPENPLPSAINVNFRGPADQS
jgi:hypothetical protein